jgi:hypothetical protein
MTNDTLWLDRVLGPDGMEKLGRRIAEAGAEGESQLFRGAVASEVKSCLHVDVLAFLADGWRTAGEIRDAARDGGTTVLKLGAHSVSREMKPVLTISGLRKPLDIAVVFTGTFEGVELSVADGALAGLGSGTCDLEIAFELAGRPLQDPITLKQWKMPGEYRFDPPLPIP